MHGVEICRDRHDQRSCKIFVSCVNFSRKQRVFLHNIWKRTRLYHLFYIFIYTLCNVFQTYWKILHIKFNLNQKRTTLWVKKSQFTRFVCVKIICPKIWSCKIVDKFQVCPCTEILYALLVICVWVVILWLQVYFGQNNDKTFKFFIIRRRNKLCSRSLSYILEPDPRSQTWKCILTRTTISLDQILDPLKDHGEDPCTRL